MISKNKTSLSASLALAAIFQFAACSLAAPNYDKIVGDWQSNFGPVHVDFVAKESPDGSAKLSGEWKEPPGEKKGKIEAAHYNANTGALEVAYEETWSKNHGKAKLQLDKSGKKISGQFKSDDGSTGTWTWTRK